MTNLSEILSNLDGFTNAKESQSYYLDENDILVDYQKNIISNDISLFRGVINFKNDININESSKINGLCIDITLDGEFNATDNLTGAKFSKTKNTTLVNFINKTNLNINCQGKNIVKNMGIIINGEFLNKYFLSQINSDFILRNYEKNITTNLKQINQITKTTLLANEILHCIYNKKLEDIFLQSKVYEIIYNELNQIISKKDKNPNIKFTNDDIEALKKAKELITKEKLFISVKELSRKVALNEFKLKYGFRHFYKISVGQMILQTRLIEAKKLLETSELNINEIAQIVGYKYTQSFSAAFKAKFKLSPKDVMKNRKYYY